MKFENVYFVNGTAYAGKSTLVRRLSEKYGGIHCGENYHDDYFPNPDPSEFPFLSYTKTLSDWHDFVRRTPDEYEAWIRGTSKECEILELRILETLSKENRPVFADTNISLETLHKISDKNHVIIMLADPAISVSRFFERPDREKQFLYRLLMEEENPEKAMANFRECLSRINTPETCSAFLHSGFPVILRDEKRTEEETLALAEDLLGLREKYPGKETW